MPRAERRNLQKGAVVGSLPAVEPSCEEGVVRQLDAIAVRHPVHPLSVVDVRGQTWAICTRRAGKLYKTRSRLAGWLGYRMNHQKLMVPEISSGPRQEKRDNPHTRLTGLGAGLVP